jgi:Protein of unknown function DUF262
MNLVQEISQKRKEIFTDSYPMSIGELVNLYRDGDLQINPAFQRFYRWKESQKIKLIESIFLGIPLPSIFVAQREDGVWDLVDGLQRVSTILNFMNILKDENNELVKPLKLTATDYLPALVNVTWGKGENELDDSLKRLFKREKIEIKIIKKESDTNTKFELFQRLNTGGSNLSDQEVRNCLIIMLNEKFYNVFFEISKIKSFNECINISDRLSEERYEMELALRVFSLARATNAQLRAIVDVSDFLTDSLKILAEDNSIDWVQESEQFKLSFDAINAELGENAFKRYSDDRWKGSFQLSIFEVIATGSFLYTKSGRDLTNLRQLISRASKALGQDQSFNKYSGSGAKANYRLPRLVPLAKRLFLDESEE